MVLTFLSSDGASSGISSTEMLQRPQLVQKEINIRHPRRGKRVSADDPVFRINDHRICNKPDVPEKYVSIAFAVYDNCFLLCGIFEL